MIWYQAMGLTVIKYDGGNTVRRQTDARMTKKIIAKTRGWDTICREKIRLGLMEEQGTGNGRQHYGCFGMRSNNSQTVVHGSP